MDGNKPSVDEEEEDLSQQENASTDKTLRLVSSDSNSSKMDKQN
jgi:hypothetical protein